MSVAEILYEQYKVLPESIQKELKALINGKDESVSVSVKALKSAIKEVKELKEGKTHGRPISELLRNWKMKIEIQTLPRFDREFKRLSKKYKSLLSDLRTLSELLSDNPQIGTNLGAGLHKIRLGSESKGGGKSGGFRVITYFIEQRQDTEIVYLVTIYDKSEEENITKKELLKIITNLSD